MLPKLWLYRFPPSHLRFYASSAFFLFYFILLLFESESRLVEPSELSTRESTAGCVVSFYDADCFNIYGYKGFYIYYIKK